MISLVNPAVALLRVYQKFFSGLKTTPTCRFLPTCSTYAIESLEEYGLVVGGLKSFKRLCSCHPFSKGGFDPVQKKVADLSTSVRQATERKA